MNFKTAQGFIKGSFLNKIKNRGRSKAKFVEQKIWIIISKINDFKFNLIPTIIFKLI